MNHADIQGNVVLGFNKPFQRFVALRLPDDVEAARRWLGKVADEVTSSQTVKDYKDNGTIGPATWLGVGLTWTGLTRLGVPDLDSVLRDDYAFRAGPAARAPDLGDIGAGAPARWLFGPVDAVVTCAADTAPDAEKARRATEQTARRHGVRVVHTLEGAKLEGGREHFGFRDGGSQPQVAGLAKTPDTQPGEIVIGEASAAPPRAELPSWLRNGSFQVLRVLAQDVRRWRAATGGRDEDWIGRTRDGGTLRRTPPGSHARKAHPAAEFEPERRRIVRRGIPYGPPYDADAKADRGLIFNAFMASIDRQYEYVQILWANREDFPGPGTGHDRVIGAPGPVSYAPSIARFVTTRAAVYALAPGIAGLREIAAGGPRRGGVPLAAKPPARRSGSRAGRRRTPA
ncbi:MAG TPA: Dyp-type peroxidase [Solirubrobacteraceae bacterium]